MAKGFDGYDPASNYAPHPPEVNDNVKVYETMRSEYYVIGKVINYNEASEIYTIIYESRFGTWITITAHATLVEYHPD